MRKLTRNVFVAGAVVGGCVVAGAALIPPSDDGDYHLRIYKENDTFKLDGKPGGGNPSAPYKLKPVLGTIDWTFTNDTKNDTLRVWIENFACDGNPVTDCPLTFDKPNACGSAEVPLRQGETQVIGAYDKGGRCPQRMGPDLWDYHIKVRTTTPATIADADPQLVIVRDGLTKFLDSVKFLLRSVKRVLHL